MMKAVVTGATSMIGSALIKECIDRNSDVLAIVRKNTKKLDRLPVSERLRVEYADLDSLSSVEGKGYDVFYHFAWGHTDKSERDDPVLQEANILYTLNAVKLSKKLGCKKFIGAGSQAEYGSINTVINENTACNPEVAYGMAKLAACMLSKKYAEQLGIRHIWARIFSVYGINDSDKVMIKYALSKFTTNKEAHFSAANNIWNYLNEKDAGVIFYLLGVKEVDDGIYCIASNEERELKSYIEDMRRLTNTQSSVFFDLGGTASINLKVDITKLKVAIDYIPRVSFENGIISMLSLYSDKKEGGRLNAF